MAIVIGVRFARNSKIYYFDPSDVWPAIGDGVICDTSRGPEYGIVAASAREVEDDMLQLPLRKVISMATEEDVERVRENEKLGREAMLKCKDKIAEHKLEMKLIDVEVAFDNSKMVFYFTANGRVDFRELVKDLAAVFKTRIELRQIGVRDEAKLLGGLGPCGRPICCGTFLSNFQPVSIKMAKEQNLSLNPTKISGLCGRLMCCLKYEEDYYEMMTKRLPRAGRDIMTPDGLGTVVDIDVLREKVKARIQLPDNTFDVRTYEYADCSRPEPGARQAAEAARSAAPAPEQERGQGRARARRAESDARPADRPDKPDRPGKSDKADKPDAPRAERRRKQAAPSPRPAVEAQEEKPAVAVDFAPDEAVLDVTDVSFDDELVDVGAEVDLEEELNMERELFAIAHEQNARAEARFAAAAAEGDEPAEEGEPDAEDEPVAEDEPAEEGEPAADEPVVPAEPAADDEPVAQSEPAAQAEPATQDEPAPESAAAAEQPEDGAEPEE